MKGASVETTLARCLIDPNYLETLIEGNSLIPRSQLVRIRLFGGFITKVKHNDTWEFFPKTRRLLAHFDWELSFFSKYRQRIGRNDGKQVSRENKIRGFCDFLEEWLTSLEGHRSSFVLEALRHERNIWEASMAASATAFPQRQLLARLAVTPEEFALLTWSGFKKLIPVFSQPLRIGCFSRDPAEIISTPSSRRLRLPKRKRSSTIVGYLSQPNGKVQTIQLDPTQAAVFSSISGRSTIQAVIERARTCGLRLARPLQFRRFFEDAATVGVLVLLKARV